MSKKLSPIVSEFETEEEAESYYRWFRAKVEAAMKDPGPLVPHDEVMATIDKVIADAGKRAPDREVLMSKKLSPIVSEFETEEEAESYDRWFRARVEAAMKDDRPSVPHDQVMAEIDAIIQAAIERKKSA